MVWRKLLLAAIVVVFTQPIGAAQASTGSCTQVAQNAGLCEVPTASARISGGGVDVEAQQRQHSSGSGGGSQTGPVVDTAPQAPTWISRNEGAGCVGLRTPAGCLTASTGTQSPTAVTLADIAHFVPQSGSAVMEPDGWAIIGLPANFYATSRQHVLTGEVLSRAASVRFTPVAFRWDYGDGSGATVSVAGSPWAAEGLPEFTDTATSHRFEAAGSYTVRSSVIMAPEYAFSGQSWTGIAGTINVPLNTLTVVVGTATTVLVDRDCRGSDGPGCGT